MKILNSERILKSDNKSGKAKILVSRLRKSDKGLNCYLMGGDSVHLSRRRRHCR